MNAPTAEQEAQYDALLAAGADPDGAAYVAGIDECRCTMPWQRCRMCRGADKMRNAPADLAEILELSASVHVAAIGNLVVVDGPPWNLGVIIEVGEAAIRALIDSGHYNEWSCHIGGRTTPMHVAEPATDKATGPVFTCMHPEPWKAVRE